MGTNREVGGTATAVYADSKSTRIRRLHPTNCFRNETRRTAFPGRGAGCQPAVFQAGWQPAPRNGLADHPASVTMAIVTPR